MKNQAKKSRKDLLPFILIGIGVLLCYWSHHLAGSTERAGQYEVRPTRDPASEDSPAGRESTY